MKYVTIATDISCSPKQKITTWACYIRFDGGVIKQVGQFKKFYKNTALAETYALINALTIARLNVPYWGDAKVIIYNEVDYVLRPILNKGGRIRKTDRERAESIKNIAIPILEQALEWEKRDIKAHFKGWKKSDNPKKYAINRWCDVESRKLMREIRRAEIGR